MQSRCVPSFQTNCLHLAIQLTFSWPYRLQRPYACKTAGIPLRCTYDFHSRRFTFDYINPIPTDHPLASVAPTHPQSEAEPGRPPLVGLACRARETEIYLPRRRYGQAARDGHLRVKLRDGDGEWRYDEEVRAALVFFAAVASTRLTLILHPLSKSAKPSTSCTGTLRQAISTLSK